MSDFSVEFGLWREGYRFVAGIDEVGRGPIAGPVVAAAVVFPAILPGQSLVEREKGLDGVNDSKLLTPLRRWQALGRIRGAKAVITRGMLSAQIIDDIGIGRAVRTAMSIALLKQKIPADFILVDGKLLPGEEDFEKARQILSQRARSYSRLPGSFLKSNIKIPKGRAIVKGDSICLSISAASIAAKVLRDRLMSLYGIRYPDYGFEVHKGYGTEFHMRMLAKLGPTPLHRYSFSPLANYSLSLETNHGY